MSKLTMSGLIWRANSSFPFSPYSLLVVFKFSEIQFVLHGLPFISGLPIVFLCFQLCHCLHCCGVWSWYWGVYHWWVACVFYTWWLMDMLQSGPFESLLLWSVYACVHYESVLYPMCLLLPLLCVIISCCFVTLLVVFVCGQSFLLVIVYSYRWWVTCVFCTWWLMDMLQGGPLGSLLLWSV